jgi:hypothetical protein
VQIWCIHVCKWKNDTCETAPERGGALRKVKENGGGGEFKYLIFGIL